MSNMAAGSSSGSNGNRSILDMLKNFKPPEKPKLNYEPSSTTSSPGGSPVLKKRGAIINLDSDSDVEETTCLDPEENVGSPELFESEHTKKNDTENHVAVSPVKTPDDVIDLEASQTNREINGAAASSSDEEILRPVKRKGPALNKKKNKRQKKCLDSDDDSGVHAENYENGGRVYDSEEEEEGDVHFKKALRTQVVDLLDNGAEKDLNAIPNMNPKKLDIIRANRPYSTWNETVQKMTATKGLNCSMLNTIAETIMARDIVFQLMGKCEDLATKMGKKVSSGGTLVTKAPSLINPDMKLTSYQMVGLNWLALMRSRSLNSILADEMGLGKTIQVIAFLAYLKESGLILDGYPHLVIVPSSTLDNWYNEFEKWCPSLNVQVYHGNQLERQILRKSWNKIGFGDAEVILTTYSCATSCFEEKRLFRKKEFNYIVFDEAHMLKNMNTQRYDALIQFNGNFKILLTGTPLQNNLLELMSLLIFLMPDFFKKQIPHIKLLFSKCAKTIDADSSVYEKERLNQAKRIIEPFMLRRLKENVLRDLPPKTIVVEKCAMLPEQKDKYDNILMEFKEVSEAKDSNSHMVYFMMLRKMANHPLLLRYFFTEDKLEKMAQLLAKDPDYKGTTPQYIQEDLYFKSDFELHCLCQNFECLSELNYQIPSELFLKSGKFEKLAALLDSLKEGGHRVLIFSQFILMLDILEVFCEVKGFNFLRLDGSTQTDDRQDLINHYNENSNIFAFLLSTRAGGLGINLTAADTVIIHDIDFNPYNDKQAEDRCHRVGQTKPVKVFKLISEGTIEEGMLSSATNKLYLEKEITAVKADESTDTKTVLQLLKENLGIRDPI